MEPEELNTDTPSNVPFSILIPFDLTHFMSGHPFTVCVNVTSQVRLRVFAAMEEPKIAVFTSGGSGPTLKWNNAIRRAYYSPSQLICEGN